MPSVSNKQRIAAAIAEHDPGKLLPRNQGMLKMSKAQLHDYASKPLGSQHQRKSVMVKPGKQI